MHTYMHVYKYTEKDIIYSCSRRMCGYRVIPLFYPSVQLTFFNHMHEALLLQLKKKGGRPLLGKALAASEVT